MVSCTDICRSILSERLIRFSNLPTSCSADILEHKSYVSTLLKSTVSNGESNSALIIGPRGSGKTSLMNSVLDELASTPNFSRDAVVVKLHGFFQTDDRIAIQEITRQLFLEKETENKVFGTFSENLNFLLDSLKSADRKSTKSIIFILDEFDLFCQHKNQTLLYNLLDVCQSAQAPMAVIGLTCRMDAISLFEKRVRSRFSHRQIYLLTKPNLDNFSANFERLLHLEAGKELKTIYARNWNKSIQDLMVDPSVHATLKKIFNLNSRFRLLQNVLFLAISQLDDMHPFLSAKDIVAAYESQTTDCKTLQLQGLSVLELQLLLSMKYLDKIYYGEPCNYEMAFYEYSKQMRSSSMQKFDRLIAMKAMEHLETLELVRPVDGTQSSKIQKEFVVYHVLVTSEQLSAALLKYPNLPTEVKQWAESCL